MKWNLTDAQALRVRLPSGKGRRAIVLELLLAGLLLLPVGMGGYCRVPVIGWAEALVNDSCLVQLQHAQDACLVTVALYSAISGARSAEACASVLGVGDLAPGDGKGALAGLRELVGRVKNVALRPGDLISLPMLLFSQIAITAYVIPGVVFLIFPGLWFSILRAPSGAETGGAPSGRAVPAPMEEAR